MNDGARAVSDHHTGTEPTPPSASSPFSFFVRWCKTIAFVVGKQAQRLRMHREQNRRPL